MMFSVWLIYQHVQLRSENSGLTNFSRKYVFLKSFWPISSAHLGEQPTRDEVHVASKYLHFIFLRDHRFFLESTTRNLNYGK